MVIIIVLILMGNIWIKILSPLTFVVLLEIDLVPHSVHGWDLHKEKLFFLSLGNQSRRTIYENSEFKPTLIPFKMIFLDLGVVF